MTMVILNHFPIKASIFAINQFIEFYIGHADYQ